MALRAKDKSFNAKLKTDFDESITKINVIPQDIGRVDFEFDQQCILCCSEKRNTNLDRYEPTVLVSTKKLRGKVEIKVKDNGNGIP
jgi:two-component system, NtrC family, sensor kinase